YGERYQVPRNPAALGAQMSTPEVIAREFVVVPGPALMRISGLGKSYGDQQAITDISFSVSRGEIVALIGPNGAGKTTVLEAVAGILPADNGEILWRGKPLPVGKRRES